MKRGQRQKLRNGVWPGWAPVGYKNNPYTRGIDLDKEKAAKVMKIFELYSTGAYTLQSLANWCKTHNLRSRCDKLMTINGIQLMLQNVFYIGLTKYKSEM